MAESKRIQVPCPECGLNGSIDIPAEGTPKHGYSGVASTCKKHLDEPLMCPALLKAFSAARSGRRT
jgi:hypothetical protein